MAPRKKKRRTPGSGSVYCPKGRNTLYFKEPSTGKRRSTGIPDTPENRAKLLEMIDTGYLQQRWTGINPFEKLDKKKITIGQAHDLFMASYGASKREKTRSWYMTSYNALLKPCEAAMLTEQEVTRAIEKGINSHDMKSVSQLTYIRSLRVFINWCVKKDWLEKAPDFDYLKKEHVKSEPAALPQIYTDSEVAKLVKYLKHHDEELGLFIRFLLESGFRFHEARELKFTDIDEKNIRVDSKDSKRVQQIPLHSALKVVVDELRTRAKANGDPSGYVFSYSQSEYLYKGLRKRLNAAMDAVGMVRDGRSFHEFRKTFISRLCRAKMPLDVASKIARCRIDVMMGYYRHFDDGELMNAMEAIR